MNTATKQSSAELSSLAARVLGLKFIDDSEPGHEPTVEQYDSLLRDAKRLAGSVLSQDEEAGQ